MSNQEYKRIIEEASKASINYNRLYQSQRLTVKAIIKSKAKPEVKRFQLEQVINGGLF